MCSAIIADYDCWLLLIAVAARTGLLMHSGGGGAVSVQ